MPRSLTDFDPPELADLFASWGFKPSHAAKLLRHFYQSAGRPDFPSLDLGKALERRLVDDLPLRRSTILTRTTSSDGTTKLLIGMGDGGAVESVLMPGYDPTRAAGCVSSQIGCAMGCDFCASTRRGLERNLESGEIVEQFLHLKEEAGRAGRQEVQGICNLQFAIGDSIANRKSAIANPTPLGASRRLRTLVFMGMGEPMHNLDNVIAAIRRIGGAGMGELGWRQITVSTVGIVPGMEKLADANLNVHLALSLHAPDDATRARIIPAGRRYGAVEVMEAAKRFWARTGRIVTIEYTLLRDVNDSEEQASLLANLMAGFRAHVNLIPYNPIGAGLSGFAYQTPSMERMTRFLQILRGRGVVAHFRRTRGDDVNAACGQLRETAV